MVEPILKVNLYYIGPIAFSKTWITIGKLQKKWRNKENKKQDETRGKQDSTLRNDRDGKRKERKKRKVGAGHSLKTLMYCLQRIRIEYE